MNSNEKRWVVLLIAVVIIAVVLIVSLVSGKSAKKEEGQAEQGEETQNIEQFVAQVEDGTKINTSEQFNNSKTYNNIEISNIQFTSKDGMSVLLADAKNIGNTTHETEIVKITLLDEQGNTVTDFNAIIAKIEPGETAKINTSINADVANVKDFKVETATK